MVAKPFFSLAQRSRSPKILPGLFQGLVLFSLPGAPSDEALEEIGLPLEVTLDASP